MLAIRKYWRYLLILFLLAFGTFFWFYDDRAKVVFKTSDGTQIRFATSTFGTNHVFIHGGALKRFFFSNFPTNGIRIGKFAWNGPARTQHATREECLLLWFHIETPPTVKITSPLGAIVHITTQDENGGRLVDWSFLNLMTAGMPGNKNTPAIIEVPRFTKKGKLLNFSFKTYTLTPTTNSNDPGNFEAFAKALDGFELKLKNPLPLVKNEWKKEETPIRKTVEGVELELTQLEIPMNTGNTVENMVFLGIGPALARAEFTLTANAEEWRVDDIYFSDQYGNRVRCGTRLDKLNFPKVIKNVKEPIFLTGALLDPNEIWNIRATLLHAINPGPSEILEIPIPNPLHHLTDPITISTNHQSIPFHLKIQRNEVELHFLSNDVDFAGFYGLDKFSQNSTRQRTDLGSVKFTTLRGSSGSSSTGVLISTNLYQLPLKIMFSKKVSFDFKIQPKSVKDFYEKYPNARSNAKIIPEP